MPVIEEWRKRSTRKVVGNIADRHLILHQKNAHFHTYIRMGLYIRMCSSIRAYAQAYTDVCGFLRDLTHEIPHVRPKNRMFFLNIKGFKIKITAF